MKVKLTYFKPSGKYYSEGEYDTELSDLYEIWLEVHVKRFAQCLPGLIAGHSEYIVSVDVPEHPHNHPHLCVLSDG